MLLVNSISASVPGSSICCRMPLKRAAYRLPVLSGSRRSGKRGISPEAEKLAKLSQVSHEESVVQTRKASEKLIESLDHSFTPNEKMNEAMDLANRIIQNSESYQQKAND